MFSCPLSIISLIILSTTLFVHADHEKYQRQNTMDPKGQDLFKEYLSRGIFSCTTKYVSTLQQLNKFITDAHEEFARCQELMDDTNRSGRGNGKKKFEDQLDLIEKMFN